MIPRYTLPEMGAVWEERAKYRHWLRIEVLAVEAWAKLGVVPEAELGEIKARATEVDPVRVDELEATLQHDVVAFLTVLGEQVGPASRWIHYGMTSSDLLDEIEHFFNVYKVLEHKETFTEGWEDADVAKTIVDEAFARAGGVA